MAAVTISPCHSVFNLVLQVCIRCAILRQSSTQSKGQKARLTQEQKDHLASGPNLEEFFDGGDKPTGQLQYTPVKIKTKHGERYARVMCDGMFGFFIRTPNFISEILLLLCVVLYVQFF